VSGKTKISSINKSDSLFDMVPKEIEQITDRELQIVFLGTGAASSYEFRNESAILLDFFDHGAILFDCGGGTFSQLSRKYGHRLDEILLNIKCICITHKHSDHHMGTISILQHRQEIIDRTNADVAPVLIIGPDLLRGI